MSRALLLQKTDSELDSVRDSECIDSFKISEMWSIIQMRHLDEQNEESGTTTVSELEKAKGSLKEDMRRLFTRIRFDPMYGNMEQRLRPSSGMFTQSSYWWLFKTR
ncbi:hypothetical protein FQN52_007113 [Onygenales sp. PD_12]|nr:hypothetical protein FQN52_007113 [Onygenales sp. PD_12]